MKRNSLPVTIAVLALVLLLVGMPWFHAYRSYSSASGYAAIEDDRIVHCRYVDKTHFDAYKTVLWIDESLSVTGRNGVIYCNDTPIHFPAGKNVALVRSRGDVTFVHLGDKYFGKDAGSSEVYYILGKVPRFKENNKGMVDMQKVKKDQVIQEEWASFLGVSPSTATGQSNAAADAAKPGR